LSEFNLSEFNLSEFSLSELCPTKIGQNVFTYRSTCIACLRDVLTQLQCDQMSL
jgi:hypothetical protein